MLNLSVLTYLCLATLSFAADYTNVLRNDGPDPFIVYDKSSSAYYFLTTTGKDLQITTAPTLNGLKTATPHVAYQNNTMQAVQTVWAPEIHKIGGSWYLYYSHALVPYVIKGGASPLDPYPGPPIQLSPGGIDGTVLSVSSTFYFVWSCWRPIAGSSDKTTRQSICISEMTSPTTIDNANIKVISQPTEAWETSGQPINEGPQGLYWENEVYLTYSGSYCGTAQYSLGLLHLTGTDPLDPASWTKHQGSVFSSANGEYGTGHNGIFTSPDGTELWNTFHAVTNPAGSWFAISDKDRATFAMKVDVSNFKTSGPNFGRPQAPGVSLPGPSGEDLAPAAHSASAIPSVSDAGKVEATGGPGVAAVGVGTGHVHVVGSTVLEAGKRKRSAC